MEGVEEARNTGICRVRRRPPWAEIERNVAAATGETAEAIGVIAVVENAGGEEVHLQNDAGVGCELKLWRGHARGGENSREFVIREKEVEDRRRIERSLEEAQTGAAVGIFHVPGAVADRDFARASDGSGHKRQHNGIVIEVFICDGSSDVELKRAA